MRILNSEKHLIITTKGATLVTYCYHDEEQALLLLHGSMDKNYSKPGCDNILCQSILKLLLVK